MKKPYDIIYGIKYKIKSKFNVGDTVRINFDMFGSTLDFQNLMDNIRVESKYQGREINRSTIFTVTFIFSPNALFLYSESDSYLQTQCKKDNSEILCSCQIKDAKKEEGFRFPFSLPEKFLIKV